MNVNTAGVPKVLIGTLFSGENELERCVASVGKQEGVVIEQVVIKFLPKQEAHRVLYQMFEDRKGAFDYLVKLDADMCFSRPTALVDLLKRIDTDVDIAAFSVHDFFTDAPMQSVNIFSNRCEFRPGTNDALFTDQLDIHYTGKKIYQIDEPAPSVLHAFDPDLFQAFNFGVHRAMKVVQPGMQLNLAHAFHQHRNLCKLHAHWLRNTADLRLWHAIRGAIAVFLGKVEPLGVYDRSKFSGKFQSFAPPQMAEWSWMFVPSIGAFIRLVGFQRFLGASVRFVGKRLAKYVPMRRH